MTSVITRLTEGPSSKRLQENLHDLIIIAWERLHNRPGSSLRLEAFRYVCGARHDEKSFMLCVVQVKDLERNENTTLALTFRAEETEYVW